ncbi:beta-glucosidase BglX [Flavobacterium restrictum]|uniref:Periplasmic beta-glucosidase n=1 Tax=Flavobacterium restrictum TaxID=2594428 RepID=A0A553ECY9_9FLAO|nr:beta-glucosidase BglX [Flavobacterium restrictum]TRX42909.1 beta-glucosidase BglX [Flavobacterium restrictum]
MKKILVITLLGISFFGYSQSKKTNNEIVIKPKAAFVAELLSKMTLDEKIGQLNLPTAGDITTGEAKSSNVAKKVAAGQVGSLFNLGSVTKIKEFQRIAVEQSRMKIPLLFGMDVIHGYRTTFPIPLGLSCTWDMALIERSARIAAQEASADGLNWTFSPMVDISRDPRWGRVSEGSGEDPYLGSQVARAMVKGYQGDDLSKNNTILSCIKHFALYGAVEAGRDYNTVDMSKVRMYNDYFPPYKAGIDAGAGTVMASFNEIDGVPASGNKWLLTDVLRNQWGFKGFVVSDYTGINEMVEHGVGDLQTVSALSLNAGLEMDMVGEGFLTTLKKSLQEGKVTQQQIDTAVTLILNAKYDLGLFQDPYKYCDEARSKTEVYTQSNRNEARKIAAQSLVLLKNDAAISGKVGEGILPLKKSGTIAVIGPLGNSNENMAGTWSVASKQENSISLLTGIKAAVGNNAKVLYAKGSNLDDDAALEEKATMFGKTLHRDTRTKTELIAEALKIARQSDVIVAALGESAEFSGECSSRTNLEIPQAQKELLQELLKTGKPVVLVLFNGRPLVLNQEKETVPAILDVWFPGSEAGLAIADVLFGDENPSGKLTATFPRSVGQIPIYYASKNTGRPLGNKEGKFEKFRSNYIDERNEPLFPFGFGLSYTTFEYSNVKTSATKITFDEKLKVSVDIKNTGNYDGKEVVQLYIRDLVGSITRPIKELKGFQKIALKKGETKTATFEISLEDLKFYNADLKYIAEAGTFEVFIGKDAQTTNKTSFELVN